MHTPVKISQCTLISFRYSYKVVEEPEAPVAEESRTIAGRPVANAIQEAAVKEEEEDLSAAIKTIGKSHSALVPFLT